MPIICMFYGIKINIHYLDHVPPHFHAYYGEYECSVDIETLKKINGEMPNKQLKMIFEWAALHQKELMQNWYLSRERQGLLVIEPLK